jgi:very-short-patch-repair endonuclease
VDRRVVDEHVELADVAPQRADLLLVGDVEPYGLEVVRHARRVPGAREHGVSSSGELPGHLEPDPAIGAGDQRGRHTARLRGPNFGPWRLSVGMRQKSAKDVEIAALAGRQHGVVSRPQLLVLGLTNEAVGRRVSGGRLHPVHRGVYAVGHRVLTVDGRWMAATLATNGVLSHTSAAVAWDMLRSASGLIHVTVPGDPGRHRRAGIRIHRSGTLEAHDTTTHRGIPITTPIRTVLDVAATLNGRRLEQLLDRAERRLDFVELKRRIEAHPSRPGSPSLQAVLSRYTVGSVVTRSELEEMFIRLCDEHHLPRPEVNTRVEGMECDFVWRDARLIVEVDGYAYHRSRFADDRERDVILKLAGWDVLRFAYEHVDGRGPWVAAAVHRRRLARLRRIAT